MAENVLWWDEPASRYGHVAAAVEGKLYVWGGVRKDWPYVHDGPQKTVITSVVDVLDPQVIKISNFCYPVRACAAQGQAIGHMLYVIKSNGCFAS